ncbi:MFS transporter [Vagococcus intermedius]|uniref:Uncharacterized protein n=1 Tax=Vagococcus intermedius TaxID=2991418 RepID=A0AAF0CV05_9ENTE|nr:MFS transporter [Vagococcus intermedius]WEG73488.1 hypothetical protein OL234_00850 [Vagococcus intermedius]WEG75572.1 hypothetical protein OL235_00860 [Vagococcus intermedius]
MLKLIQNYPLFTKLISLNLMSKLGNKLLYTVLLTLASQLKQGNQAIMMVNLFETLPLLFSFFLGTHANHITTKLKISSYNSLSQFIFYLLIGYLLSLSLTFNRLAFIVFLKSAASLLMIFTSSLTTPFTKLLVLKKDLQRTQGIISLFTQLVNTIGNTLGAFLFGFLLLSTIAYLNAGLFLIVWIGYSLVSPKLRGVEKTLPLLKKRHSIFKESLTIFDTLTKQKKLTSELGQLAIINGFFGGIMPLFVMYLTANDYHTHHSLPLILALFSTLTTFGLIIGAAFSIQLTRHISLSTYNIFSTSFMILTVLGFYLNSLPLIFITIFTLSILTGSLSPHFSSQLIWTYPAETLGGIVTTVNSLLALISPIAGLTFPFIALLNLNYAYYALFIYSGGTFILIRLSRLKIT